jgi:hypothetical protein
LRREAMTDTKPRPRPTDLFSQLERKRNKEPEQFNPPEYLEDNGTSRAEPLIPQEKDDL